MNLIKAQDLHVQRLLDAKPYSDSNSMGNLTPLRRKLSAVRASRKKYRKDLESLGFSDMLIRITMKDAEDLAKLEYMAK